MDYHYKDLAAILFARFEDYARELCERNQRDPNTARYEFTSQQMLKKAAQQNQDAYVQWLERSRVRFPNEIFNKAHEDIGREISRRAEQAGFEKIIEQGRSETDIFGNPTRRVTYKPKA